MHTYWLIDNTGPAEPIASFASPYSGPPTDSPFTGQLYFHLHGDNFDNWKTRFVDRLRNQLPSLVPHAVELEFDHLPDPNLEMDTVVLRVTEKRVDFLTREFAEFWNQLLYRIFKEVAPDRLPGNIITVIFASEKEAQTFCAQMLPDQ